jgi:hypothetical protein
MQRHVVSWKKTDISEVRTASIIRAMNKPREGGQMDTKESVRPGDILARLIEKLGDNQAGKEYEKARQWLNGAGQSLAGEGIAGNEKERNKKCCINKDRNFNYYVVIIHGKGRNSEKHADKIKLLKLEE